MPIKRFAIFGQPVLHSKSPLIHNRWFRENNLAAHYNRVIAEDALTALSLGYKLNLRGANVTAPFKEKVIPALVRLSPEAESIKAVNTLIYDGPNIAGYNTDVNGVGRAFELNKISLRGKKCFNDRSRRGRPGRRQRPENRRSNYYGHQSSR